MHPEPLSLSVGLATLREEVVGAATRTGRQQMQVVRKTLGLVMLASLVVGATGVELAGASPTATTATTATASLTRAQKKSIAITIEYGPSGTWTKYHNRYPSTFNWTNDGCSVPGFWLALLSPAGYALVKHYSGVFHSPCVYHDFGYRNFGSKRPASGPYLHLDPTSARRKSIDDKFHSRMDSTCNSKYGSLDPRRYACREASDLFYGAVRARGSGSFFA
jgi:Prokaryotic phospholipase A2